MERCEKGEEEGEEEGEVENICRRKVMQGIYCIR